MIMKTLQPDVLSPQLPSFSHRFAVRIPKETEGHFLHFAVIFLLASYHELIMANMASWKSGPL